MSNSRGLDFYTAPPTAPSSPYALYDPVCGERYWRLPNHDKFFKQHYVDLKLWMETERQAEKTTRAQLEIEYYNKKFAYRPFILIAAIILTIILLVTLPFWKALLLSPLIYLGWGLSCMFIEESQPNDYGQKVGAVALWTGKTESEKVRNLETMAYIDYLVACYDQSRSRLLSDMRTVLEQSAANDRAYFATLEDQAARHGSNPIRVDPSSRPANRGELDRGGLPRMNF